MDDALDRIIGEAARAKQPKICEACYVAKEIVSDKSALLKNPVFEVRTKCLAVVELCLASKNSKLTASAISAIQRLLRDTLYWTVDTDDEDLLLPVQVTTIVSAAISNQQENVQIDLLKVLLEMACTGTNLLSHQIVISIVDIALIAVNVQSPSQALQSASIAAASQTVECFVKHLDTEQTDFEDDLFPLLTSLAQKLNERRKLRSEQLASSSKLSPSGKDNQTAILLKCVHSALAPLTLRQSCEDGHSSNNEKLLEFVWKTLCPLLIKLISGNDFKIKGTEYIESSSHNYGRGSESSEMKSATFEEEIRPVFNIGAQLIRLFALTKSMRPVLESLFHRLLLFPPINSRHEALKATADMFRNADLVVKIACTSVDGECDNLAQSASHSHELDLLKIFIDSFKECSYSNDTSISYKSVVCVTTLISTLELITCGQGISAEILSEISKCAATELPEKASELEVPDKAISSEAANERFPVISMNLKDFKLNDYKSKLDDILHSMKATNEPEEEKATERKESQLESHNNADEDADVSSSTCTDDEGHHGGDDEDISESSETGARLRKLLESEHYHERKNQMTPIDSHDEVARNERENARLLVKQLMAKLPNLITTKNAVEVDDKLQRFASDFCKELWRSQHELVTSPDYSGSVRDQLIIVNGDGIYLTIYMALSLNLKLRRAGYYEADRGLSSAKPEMAESQFVYEIQNSGLVIHLSQTWLAEVYQQVLAVDILSLAGADSEQSIPLINLMIDLDGLGDTQPGSQELTGYKKLSCGSAAELQSSDAIAGRKIVIKILSTFWSSMLTSLGCLFRNENDHSTQGLLAVLADTDPAKDLAEKRTVLVKCLDGLQVAAKMCITLGLQSRCNGILDLLTKSVCPTELDSVPVATGRRMSLKRHLRASFPPNSEQFSLHTSQVLSMKAILNSALEIGSHCTPCWEFVFRVCEYIIGLENSYFSKQKGSVALKTRKAFSSLLKGSSNQNSDDLAFEKYNESDHIPCMPGMDIVDANKALDLCVEQCSADPSNRSVLKGRLLENAIESLYQLVEKMFDESASRLNLKALIGFLSALSSFSKHELLARRKQADLSLNSSKSNPLLFTRFCDLILRVSKSGRPLVHFLRAWAETVPHLVEAACYTNDVVSKTAVSTINDVLTATLSTHNEQEHFHFNEGLFKPYETLMLLELCDSDIQEMIISSICGFVEGFPEEIKSGWRTLFGALRGIQLPNIPLGSTAADAYELEVERVRQLRVILDIFEAFLDSNNLNIFSNAAVDCLLCLFKLLRDPASDESPSDEFELLERPVSTGESSSNDHSSVDLCLLSLKYLHQFECLLRSMYRMPACPLFSSTRRITVCSEPKVIEQPPHFGTTEQFSLKVPILLSELDRPVRILHVWFLLLDGLTNSIISCPKQHQARIVEMSLALVGTLRESPCIEFAMYSLNHIVLPLAQRWLRELNVYFALHADYFQAMEPNQWTQFTNFKHFCGLISHLVAEHIKLSLISDAISESNLNAVDLLLTQTLIVFLEPLDGNYHDCLFQLTSSCFRHILVELVPLLRPSSWDIVCNSLDICNSLCLKSLNQLIEHFPNETVQFFEDLQRIKIITKRDSTPRETQRLCGLAQQLFLSEAQKSEDSSTMFKSSVTCDGDDRSFVFLVEATEEREAIEIHYRTLLYEINCHELLIKTVGRILLQGTRHRLPNLDSSMDTDDGREPLISKLETRHVKRLLLIVEKSYDTLCEFDKRPGLKFLLQKVSRLDVPANLYQQSAMCFSVSFLTNYYFCQSPDESESRDNYTSQLGSIFAKVCDKYSDFVAQNERSNSKLDELALQPIFLMSCEIPFTDVIGRKSLEIKRDISEILNAHSSTESSPSRKSDKSSGGRDLDTKAYSIVTQSKIEQMTDEYKKWKKQHAPVPPDIVDRLTRKKALPKRYSNSENSSSVERVNDNCLVRDADVFVSLWVRIFDAVLKMHAELPEDDFRRLIKVFEPGVELLIIYMPHKDLRSSLTQWLRRLSSVAAAKQCAMVSNA